MTTTQEGAHRSRLRSPPYGRTDRGVGLINRRTLSVAAALIAAGTAMASCRTLTKNAPLAVTSADATNAALRHVWSIDDTGQVQSFLRGTPDTGQWRVEAPLSDPEDTAIATSEGNSGIAAISYADASGLHERAYYVGETNALRVIAYDGGTRRYITDTMGGSGVRLTGALSAVVYSNNTRVVVGVGSQFATDRQLFRFVGHGPDEPSYSIQSFGSPGGLRISAGNDVVASATDTFTYCAFVITEKVGSTNATVSALGLAGNWFSATLNGAHGEIPARSVAAVRWTGSDSVAHYSSFVRSNLGNVWEAIWNAACDSTPTWRNLGMPPGGSAATSLSAALDANNRIVVAASADGGRPYSKTYAAGATPPSSWTPVATVNDVIGAAGTVLVDPFSPSTVYFLGNVGAAGVAHLYENSSSDTGPGLSGIPVYLASGPFAEEPWTESHFSEQGGRSILSAMVTRRDTDETRIAVGTSDADGNGWTTALAPISPTLPPGGAVLQGDPTTIIESNGTMLTMFHEIPLSTCVPGPVPALGAHAIRLLSVTTTTDSSGASSLSFSPMTTPTYFTSQGHPFLDHPWMVRTSDGVEHFAWYEEDRDEMDRGKMGYAARKNGTFAKSATYFAAESNGLHPGGPYMAVSGGSSVYIGWEKVPFGVFMCKWPNCGTAFIANVTAKAGTCVARGGPPSFRGGAVAFAGTSSANTVYAVFTADRDAIPNQTLPSCPNAFPTCPTAGAGTEVVFTQSTDGGATWSCAQRVQPIRPPIGVNQFAPTLTVQGGSNAFITYFEQESAGSSVFSEKIAIRSSAGTWVRGTRTPAIDTNMLPIRCADSGHWMGDYRVAIGETDHVHAMRVDTSPDLPNRSIMTVSAMSPTSWR